MTAKFNRPNNGVTVMRSGHKPLRTTAELAAEFGVSAQSLARFLLTSEIKPMMTKDVCICVTPRAMRFITRASIMIMCWFRLDSSSNKYRKTTTEN